MKTLVIVGAGGHGSVCADIAEQTGRYRSIVFSDEASIGKRVAGKWLVEFCDNDLMALSPDEYEFIIAVGQTGFGTQRQTVLESIGRTGLTAATVISPDAYVAQSARIDPGTLIGRMAIVQPNARIGENTIINSKALIEHDAVVGSHCHISTGAIVNGGTAVGDRCLIGSGAVILHGVTVNSDVIIGAGAVVTGNITEPGTYVGIPARPIEKRRAS